MIESKTIFSAVAIILTFLAYIPYIRDTLMGKTTPHAYTWFTFGTATAVIFALQLSAGAGAGAWITLVISLTVFFIFALSLKRGEKNITLLDTTFFISALIALGLWIFAKQPMWSAVLLAVTNALGFAPTIRKSWNNPFSETLSTYVINTTRHFVSLFALASYNVITYIYPLSATIITGGFVITLLIRRKILGTIQKR
ncbi:MAG TPA: hypothetical protein VEC13_03515 [Candidatus Paceibacterota bacterium]|nr:hypothetical protein [Candidatus Paceibacterota bacterium]